jgi:hypothetical protein
MSYKFNTAGLSNVSEVKYAREMTRFTKRVNPGGVNVTDLILLRTGLSISGTTCRHTG